MNNFYATCNKLANSTIEILTDAVQKGGVLGGRAVEYAKALPEKMHQDSNTAITTFLVANLVFLGIATLFSRFLENLSDGRNGFQFGSSHNSYKNIAIRFIVIGGAVTGFNMFLSRITEYALSNVALAAITGSQVALSLLMKLSSSSKNNVSRTDAEAKKLRRENARLIVVPNFKFKIVQLPSEQTKFIITCESEKDLNNFFEILEWGTHIQDHCYMERKSSKLQFTLRMKTDKDTPQNQTLIERNLNQLRSKFGQTVTPKKK